MLKRILTYIFITILLIGSISTFTNNEVEATGTYTQLTKANAVIKSGFEFKSGINTSVNFSSVGVFVKDCNESSLAESCKVETDNNGNPIKVNGTKRALSKDSHQFVKIPNGYKYLDGSTYDIYVKIEADKDLSSESQWILKTVSSGSYTCMELSPFNTNGWAKDPYVGFDYQIWIVDPDTKQVAKDIDLTAGSCWTAVNEGARPWGNDGIIYTNIPANVLEWEEKITANGKTYDVNCWHITNGSYNKLDKYILGRGTESDGSIKGGYIRSTVQGGSAEMMLGYFLTVSGNDYVGYYDGEYHTITSDAESVSGVTITWCSDSSCSTALNEKPKYKDVKIEDGKVSSYTVYYKVSGGSYDSTKINSNTVTIKQRPVEIAPKAKSKVYDKNTNAKLIGGDGSSELSDSNKLTIKTGVGSESFEVSKLTGTFADANVGTGKTVKVAYTTSETDTIPEKDETTGFIRTNYTYKLKNPTASIVKGSISGDVSATAYVGTYDGNTHNITLYYTKKNEDGTTTTKLTSDNVASELGVDGATITYYTDKTYSTTTTGYKDVKSYTLDNDGNLTNVDSYTVYYRINLGDNYESIVGYSTVTINPLTVYVNPTALDREYKENDTSATIVGDTNKTEANSSSNTIKATGTIGSESITVYGLTGTFDSANVGVNKTVDVDVTNMTVVYDSETKSTNYIIEVNDAYATIYGDTDGWYVKSDSYVGVYDGSYHEIKPVAKTKEGTELQGTLTYYSDSARQNQITSTQSGDGYIDSSTYKIKDATYDNDPNTFKTIYYKFESSDTNHTGTKEGQFIVFIVKRDVEVSPNALSRYYKDGDTSATIVNDSGKKVDATNTLEISTGVGSEKFTIGTEFTANFVDSNGNANGDPGTNKKVVVSNKSDIISAITDNGDFKKSNYNITIKDTTASIYKENMIAIAEPYVDFYNGTLGGIDVTVYNYDMTAEESDYTISYYTDAAMTETDNMHKDVKWNDDGSVGSYTVYFKVEKDGYKTVTGSSTVTIYPKTIDITPSANSKKYDGNTDAVVNSVSNYSTGVGSEAINVSDLTGKFESAGVGNNKKVYVESDNDKITAANTSTNLSNYNIIIENTTASIYDESSGGDNGGGTRTEANTPCEEWNHSKNWTWSEKLGKCVYRVGKTSSK